MNCLYNLVFPLDFKYGNTDCFIIASISNGTPTNEIIIFTDSDSQGEAIRRRITAIVPNAKQAFLRKKDAISKNKKKVGIEHADADCIKESLENLYTFNFQEEKIKMI